MSVYKFTFIMNMGRNGWSESWYADNATLSGAIGDIRTLAALRYDLLGAGVKIDGVRAQYPLVRGYTTLVSVTEPANRNNKPCPDPWDAALYSVRAVGSVVGDENSIYRRNFLMRGLPVDFIGGGQTTGEVENAPMATAAGAFFKRLSVMGGQLSVRKKTPAVSVITAGGANGGQLATFTTKAAHPFTAGQTISLSGMKYTWKPCNGQQTVLLVPDATHFTIGTPAGSGVFFPPAYAQVNALSFSPIEGAKFLRSVTRDTGKAFFATRGRYKTRKINF